MKKTILFALTFLAAHVFCKAQSFRKGDNLINVGIGIGSPFFTAGYNASLPINPTVTYEKGISDEISIGGTVSYATAKFEDVLRVNATYIAARGSYHLNEALDINNDKLDIYGGAGLGYVIVSAGSGVGTLGSAFGYTLFAGGRYYVAPKTSFYAELGYSSLSILNAGISFKF